MTLWATRGEFVHTCSSADTCLPAMGRHTRRRVGWFPRYLALCGKEFLLAGRWRRWTVSRRTPCWHCFRHLIGDVVPLEDAMSPLRVVRCDDCTYVGRYVQDDVASQRAYLHAKHKHHRTRVVNEGEEDTIYDCRPQGPTESSAERVE